MSKTEDEFFAQFGRKEGEVQFKGLKDGGHVILKCSNCRAELADCWITRPNERDSKTGELVKWQVKATCPYCPLSKSGKPEGSFIKEIQGGFHPGRIGKLLNAETMDDQPVTQILDTDIDYDKNIVTLIMGKAGDGKPQR